MDTEPEHGSDARVGQVVVILIGAMRMTQKALADAIDMDPTALSKSIKGERRWTGATLYRMAKVLGVPMDKFYDDPDAVRRQVEDAARSRWFGHTTSANPDEWDDDSVTCDTQLFAATG